MDIILNDMQAIKLIQAFKDTYFAGDGCEKHIEPLIAEGYMGRAGHTIWYKITDEGKRFVKEYLDYVYEIVTDKLKCKRYDIAIFDISNETRLSIAVLENTVLEYFAEQGLLGKIVDKEGNKRYSLLQELSE